jgi:hypothetical protein
VSVLEQSPAPAILSRIRCPIESSVEIYVDVDGICRLRGCGERDGFGIEKMTTRKSAESHHLLRHRRNAHSHVLGETKGLHSDRNR